jgi:hypothetical protein
MNSHVKVVYIGAVKDDTFLKIEGGLNYSFK